MAKKKISRKKLLKEPDEFISLSARLIEWSRANSKKLLAGTAVFLVCVFLVSAYGFFSRQREQTASALLSKGLAAYQSDAKRADDPAKTLAAVKPDFERLIEKYGRTSSGRLGRVLYAHICLASQAPDEAITLYKAALDDFGDSPELANAILNGLGMAYAQKGESAVAIGYFDRIATGTSRLFKDAALFHLGRLYAAAGENEKAKKAYDQLKTDFPDSFFVNIADGQTIG